MKDLEREEQKITYQINSTESPATSLLALTNTLHPVVSRCLLGWPTEKKRKEKHTELKHLNGK